MLENLKAYFKLGSPAYNHDYDPDVDDLFTFFIRKEWKKNIVSDGYRITITTVDNDILTFWCANKFYAWATNGEFENNSVKSKWNNARPSLNSIYLMDKKIKENFYSDKKKVLKTEYKKKEKTMKPWQHCAMKWYSIDTGLAMQNMRDNCIVKCMIDDQEFIFNIPNETSPGITVDMIKNGEWYVYTWAD